MSSTPVVIKLECDLKETHTDHVRYKLSEILKVYLENIFPIFVMFIEIFDHANIASDYRYFK
jgi:hypothetical protein